ncbi:hypothetical protein CEXT_490461 [Caerostris extrusa]|uniref:Uncharacterized protein n=1 Tax=Caerostris extrusa TaxID=172846 RepID=A0AAV4XXA7_CAEEX|nr:hypothetical protein CEXT_490461 [Caerostris extrusa]
MATSLLLMHVAMATQRGNFSDAFNSLFKQISETYLTDTHLLEAGVMASQPAVDASLPWQHNGDLFKQISETYLTDTHLGRCHGNQPAVDASLPCLFKQISETYLTQGISAGVMATSLLLMHRCHGNTTGLYFPTRRDYFLFAFRDKECLLIAL